MSLQNSQENLLVEPLVCSLVFKKQALMSAERQDDSIGNVPAECPHQRKAR